MLTSAFGQTFWVAIALIAVMVIPALFLPERTAPDADGHHRR
jgi:hypothetical protein